MKLLIEALTKFTCGLLLVCLLIFLPAGTLAYTCGWLFIGLLFVPMLIAGFVMLVKSPDFLRKRLDAKEKQAAQKGVLAFYPAIIIVRLKAEEALLTKELPGYEAYKQKVKYRLIPYVW